jgi:hypothetical protein
LGHAFAFGLALAFGTFLRAVFLDLCVVLALTWALVFGLGLDFALVLRLRLDLVGDAIVALRVMEIAS